jgi:hypothetical protein
MAVPLLFIDFPEHETVALATLEANVPDWRGLIPNVANGEAIATIMLGTDQLARVAKVGKLYAKVAGHLALQRPRGAGERFGRTDPRPAHADLRERVRRRSR